MEAELQGLKGLIEQLRADNSSLRQEQGDVPPGSMISTNVSVSLPSVTPLEGTSTVAPERLVFVPQDRKCSYTSRLASFGNCEPAKSSEPLEQGKVAHKGQ